MSPRTTNKGQHPCEGIQCRSFRDFCAMDLLSIPLDGDHYGASTMAQHAMIFFLARAAKEARKEAGIKPARVAVSIDVDPSTIYRFERGQWPQDADLILSAYSNELRIEPREIWSRAIELWTDAEVNPKNEVDRMIDEIEVTPPPGIASHERDQAPEPSAETFHATESEGEASRQRH